MIKVKLESYISKVKKSLISGPFGSNISSKFFVSDGVPVIRGNNLTFGQRKFVDQGFVFVSEEKASELNCDAVPGDIIFTAAGTIGQVGLITDDLKYQRYVISNKQIRLRVDNSICDTNFLYAILNSEITRQQILNNDTGSTIPLINLSVIRNLEIPYFDLPTQQKIAAVLSALDDKIELNNKINAELEQMAKTLYDYWFVQFDFPNAEGKPYKSSGGKMVYNESLKREIPDGWEVKELDNLINFTRGVSYTSKTMNDKEGIPMINLKSFNLNGTYRYDGIKYFTGKLNESRILDKGDLLIAITDVTREAEIIGRAIINPDFEKKSVCSCDVARVDIVGEDLKKNYLRYLFNSNSYHDYIKHFASGTLVLHLDLQGVKWFTHAIPPIRVQIEFEKFINSIDEKIALNQKQNQELAQLRDWLLPMLMNGQVRVAVAEEVLGMVAEPEVVYHKTIKEGKEDRFELWLSNQKLAARGDIDEVVLREIFSAMDDEDQ